MAASDFIGTSTIRPHQNLGGTEIAATPGIADNSSTAAITGLSGAGGSKLIAVMLFSTLGSVAKNISQGSASIANNRVKLVTGAGASNGNIQVMWVKGDKQL